MRTLHDEMVNARTYLHQDAKLYGVDALLKIEAHLQRSLETYPRPIVGVQSNIREAIRMMMRARQYLEDALEALEQMRT